MNVELLQVARCPDERRSNWQIHFVAKIGEIVVQGNAFNFTKTKPDGVISRGSYGIKLIFSDKSIKKDPKYSEIRGKLLKQIADHPEANKFVSWTEIENIIG